MTPYRFILFLKSVLFLVIGLAIIGCHSVYGEAGPAKNIIFMVPDGMGMANVTIARTYLNGVKGAWLNFETLPYIGYQRTSSKNSYVTDSAAAASAWACGEKFNNGEISCHDNDTDGQCDTVSKTILELAHEKGLSTGLVVTSDITHGTPAAFGAHVHNRECGSEIFRQMINASIEVLLGGGIDVNRSPCMLSDTNNQLIAEARSLGYTYVTDKSDLEASSGAGKLLGLFREGGLTPMYKRVPDSTEPTLAEMTTAALNTLGKDPDGFFLLVEGSQIDWANHSRNTEYMIHEVVGFQDAVKAARDWMSAAKNREGNTLLIVAADHESGGVIIKGPYGNLPEKNDAASQEIAFANHTFPFIPSEHTAVDTIIWSNSPACAGVMENTNLFYVMKNFLGLR